VTPIAVLGAYALIGVAVIIIAQRGRKPGSPAMAADASEVVSSGPSNRIVPKTLIAPIVLAVLLTTILRFNYVSSGHEPIATNMPFGVVGSSTLPHDAQSSLFSLDVKQYANQTDAKQAMDKGDIYGALIAADSSGSANQLIFVSSISDLSGLDITANFEEAAKKSGEKSP